MRISLDHQQRLNLIALMGTQRGTVADIRTLWKLQDRMELSEEEKREINYQVIAQDGAEAVRWDLGKSLPPVEVELSTAESQRLRKIVEEYPNFQLGDRKWIESLLDQLEVDSPAPTEMVAQKHG